MTRTHHQLSTATACRPAGRGGRGRRSPVRMFGAASLALLAGIAASACGSGVPSRGVAGSTGPAGTSGGGTTPATTLPSSSIPTPTTVPPPPLLGAGAEGPGSAVPWSEVGAGWTLATWRPATGNSTVTSLFLVDPLGGRYLVSSSAPAGAELTAWAAVAKVAVFLSQGTANGAATGATVTGVDLSSGSTLYTTGLPAGYSSLVSLSGDGMRALFGTALPSNDADVEDVSVTTGAILHQLTIHGYAAVEYTRPAGLALVVAQTGQPLRRVGLDGSPELTFPQNFSQVGAYQSTAAYGSSVALYSADGASLVIGAAGGLAVVSNAGSVIRQLPVPVTNEGQGSGCSPDQWWGTGQILARCTGSGQSGHFGDSFYVVPLDGSAPTRLGDADGFVGQMYQVGSGVYGQIEACGSQSVGEVTPTNSAGVDVPGLKGSSQHIVTALGSRLEILGEAGCDSPTGAPPAFSVVWFDPATRSTTFLLGPPVSTGTVDTALPYPVSG